MKIKMGIVLILGIFVVSMFLPVFNAHSSAQIKDFGYEKAVLNQKEANLPMSKMQRQDHKHNLTLPDFEIRHWRKWNDKRIYDGFPWHKDPEFMRMLRGHEFMVFQKHSRMNFEKGMHKNKVAPIPTSNLKYTAHGVIRINSNSEFASMAQSEGWPGDGSQSNPYIISGCDIDAHGAGSAIYIGNTTVYFVVENCYLHNASHQSSYVYSYGDGITLFYVKNGRINNNNCSDNEAAGINIWDSSNNVISNNTCSNNGYGIYIFFSSNNRLYGNKLTNDGIVLWGDKRTFTTQDIPTNNTVNGKPVYYYKNVSMRNATVPENAGQVILGNVSWLKIENLRISNASIAIEIGYSSNITIRNNTCSNNRGDGIYIGYSNNNTIVNNLIISNTYYGIYISTGLHNLIYNNSFLYNDGSGDAFNSRHVQAYDSGINDYWNSSSGMGNYWHDWANNNDSNDQNRNGIVDWPYRIDGSAGAKDYYPLCSPTYKFPPKQPRNLQVRRGDGYVNLSWEVPVWDGGSLITEYRVYRNGSLLASVYSSHLWYNDTTVNVAVNYTYYVVAVNGVGESPPSDTVYVKWSVPSAPVDFEVNRGDGYVLLKWAKPANDGGTHITGYRIYRNGTLYAEINADVYSFNDTNVSVRYTYTYSITAVNGVGEGLNTSEKSIRWYVPSAPGNFNAERGDGYVLLSWSKPSDDGGTHILGYVIYRNNQALVSLDASTVSYNDTDINVSNSYTYYVVAFNGVGEGENSGTYTITWNPPGAPSNFTLTRGDGYVLLRWDSPSSDGGTHILSYWIYRNNSVYAKLSANTYSYNDTNVSVRATYSYYVVAVNGVGGGSTAIMTVNWSAPGAPQNFQLRRGDGYVLLDWSAPSTDGGTHITAYRVYRNGELLAELDPNVFTYNDSSVNMSDDYHYYVVAVNGVGVGNSTSTADVSWSLPDAVQNVWYRVIGGMFEEPKLIVSWEPPNDTGGSRVRYYEIYIYVNGRWMLAGITNSTSAEIALGKYWGYGLLGGAEDLKVRIVPVNGVGEGVAVENPEKAPIPIAWWWWVAIVAAIIIVLESGSFAYWKKESEEYVSELNELDKKLEPAGVQVEVPMREKKVAFWSYIAEVAMLRGSVSKYHKMLDRYLGMKREWEDITNKLLEMKRKLSMASGIEINVRDMPVRYAALKEALPKYRLYFKSVNAKVNDYESLKAWYDRIRKKGEEYREVLSKYGVFIALPIIPVNYEEMKGKKNEINEKIEEYGRMAEEYPKLMKDWNNVEKELRELGARLSGSGVVINVPAPAKDVDGLRKQIEEYRKQIKEYRDLAKEYEDLKEKVNKYAGELEELRGKLEPIGISVEGIESMELSYLRERVPRLEADIAGYKEILNEYEELRRKWSEMVRGLQSYAKMLEGSGVDVPNPKMPGRYEDLKRDIKDLEKSVEKYRMLAEEYERLKEKATEYKNQIRDMAGRLREVGIEIAGIESMELEYLRTRLPELEKEIANAKKELEMYDRLKDKWGRLREEASKLNKAGAHIKIGSMPREIEQLRDEINRLEKEIKSYPRKVEIVADIDGEIVRGEWGKVDLILENKGSLRAEDIKLEYTGEVKIRGPSEVGAIEPSEKKKFGIRILSNDAGYVPVDMKISYRNALTGEIKKEDIMPELYVKRESEAMKMTAGAGVEHKIGIDKIKKMYEIEEKEEYSWGEFSAYKRVKVLGTGWFSVVYEVTKGRRKYAMKIPKGLDWKLGETMLLREKDLEQYGKEALIWAMLTEKVPDGVINLIDAGVHPFPWFVMELAEKSLRDVMKSISYEEKIRVVISLLDTLEKIHRLEVVHKDIKPENILYANSKWKFTDFGLSKILTKSSKSGLTSGTPWYMAPEQVAPGKKYGHSDACTDIWQMGVLLYEMITGDLPFEGDSYQEVGMAILFSEPNLDVLDDDKIRNVVERALQKKKEDRWQSAAEMKRALEEVFK